MTITTTSLGSYSTQITLSNETSSNAMITALDTAIVAGGWTQYDVYNNGTQRIYRSLNKDGSTYKYISFFIDIATFKIATSCFESWNATTHVGTNEVATYSRNAICGYALQASDVVLMVSNRWCIIQTFIRGQVSQWSGVIEVQREAAEDTAAAGYPCFAWVCSSNIFTPNPAMSTSSVVSFPRTRSGATGASAVATSLQTPYIRIGGTVGSDQLNNYVVYPYDITKRIVHSLRPTVGFTEIHGRLYGMKAMYNVGSPYSRIAVNVDSEFNYSPTGTAADHWILGESIQRLPASALATTGNNNGYLTLSTQTLNPTQVSQCSVYAGQCYYVGTSTGVMKYDAGPMTTLLSTAIAGTSGNIFDIVFDGRYVYATTATNVLRIDPTNDVVTSLTLPFGGGSAFFDGTYLWVGARIARVSNSLYKIDVSSFTLLSTITPTAANSYIGGIATDFNGNLYVLTNESNVYKVVISTGVVSTLATNVFSGSTPNSCNIIFDGGVLILGGTVSVNAMVSYCTLAGAVSGYLTLSLGATATPLVNKSSLCKFGHFILVGCGNNGTTPFAYTNAPGFVGAQGTLQSPGYIPSSVNCDGNKLWITGNQGQLSVYGSINHPDDQGVIHGRLVLPK